MTKLSFDDIASDVTRRSRAKKWIEYLPEDLQADLEAVRGKFRKSNLPKAPFARAVLKNLAEEHGITDLPGWRAVYDWLSEGGK